jgi:hypothetical protein
VTLRLPPAAVEELDRVASEAGCSRARAVERLLEGPGLPAAAPTLGRALLLLAESAEAGSISARVALARTLSDREPRRDRVQARRDELAAHRRARVGGA